MEYENRDYDGTYLSDSHCTIDHWSNDMTDEPQYPRERSRSPRPDRDGDSRLRSASPAAVRDDRYVINHQPSTRNMSLTIHLALPSRSVRTKKKPPTLAPTFSLPASTPV